MKYDLQFFCNKLTNAAPERIRRKEREMRVRIDIIKQKVLSCELCRYSFDRARCILAKREFPIKGEINREIPEWCPLPFQEISEKE